MKIRCFLQGSKNRESRRSCKKKCKKSEKTCFFALFFCKKSVFAKMAVFTRSYLKPWSAEVPQNTSFFQKHKKKCKNEKKGRIWESIFRFTGFRYEKRKFLHSFKDAPGMPIESTFWSKICPFLASWKKSQLI